MGCFVKEIDLQNTISIFFFGSGATGENIYSKLLVSKKVLIDGCCNKRSVPFGIGDVSFEACATLKHTKVAFYECR